MSESNDLKPLRIAVIGAGFSGLAAAIRLGDLAKAAGRAIELTVVDASASTGGLVATQRIGDYLVERGADAFITNKPGGVEMCRRLGLESRLIATDPRFRKSFILSQGHPVETPAGFQLIAPTRVTPFLKTPLLSWRAKRRVLSEPRVPVRRDDGEESLGAFVRRRFGDEAFDRVIQPMVGGIYTGDLDRLSLTATFPRYRQMELQFGSVLKGLKRERGGAASSGARYGLFATLPGGMRELLERMEREVIEGARVSVGTAGTAGRTGLRVNSRVSRVERGAAGGWKCAIDGVAGTFDGVVLAVPAYRAAELMGGLNEELARELAGIEYSSSAIVVSGHRLADVGHPVDGAGLVIPQVEGRRILAVSFASRKFPGRAPEGRVILRTFMGGALQGAQLEQDDAELKRIVREELASILGVRGEPDFCEVVRYSRGIPQYVIGHQARVGRIEGLAASLSGLALAGNAYRGVGIPDAIQSGLVAAAKVWKDLVGGAVGAVIDSMEGLSAGGVAAFSPIAS